MKLILILLIFISGCSQTGNIVKEISFEGPFLVTNVVDGDTLDINTSERVRLSGINTPETGECYYQESKDKLNSLVLNKKVYLELDQDNLDKYGRSLRYVYVNDTSINKILVEEGYARVFDKYNETTKRYDEYKLYENTAIEQGLGVWGCDKVNFNCKYVGSKNSKTYHLPDCKWVKRIKPENLVCYKTDEEVKDLEPSTCIK